MNDWTNTTLGAISSIKTGPFGSQLHSYEYVDIGTPVIMPQNIGDRAFSTINVAYVDDKTAKRLQRYATQANDIVYSRRGDIEKHAFITQEHTGALCGTGCFRVRINDKAVFPLFLSFYLNRPEARLRLVQHAVGSNMPNLNTEILAGVPIAFPGLSQQKAIAITLGNLDHKIAINNAINAELEKTAKLLYDYWFVQFDSPNAEGKPYRANGGEMVWNEQLKREIPKGWAVKTIGECVSQIVTGLNPRNNFVLGNGSNKYVTIKSIENGRLDFSKCDYVDDNALAKIHNRSDISADDILFTSIEPVGRLCRIWEEPQGWDINESVFSIRTDTNVVTTDFLYAAMDNDGFRATTTSLRTGSVQKGIRIGDLRSIRIAIPSKQLLTAFSTVVAPIYQKMWLLEKQNNELTALRDFLLPLLMNGQVTVASRAPKLEIVKAAPKALTKQESVFKRLILSAYILDNICDEPTAGRVKFEKLLYLCEHCAELPLYSEFYRAAAGPYDPKALYSVESQLQKNKWFASQKSKGDSRAYARLEKSKGYMPYLDNSFSVEQKSMIDKLLHHFKSQRTIECEIVATLYGAWNDFLIEGNQPTDKQIVDEVLCNWNSSKERIAPERWYSALQWMRKNGIVPIGFGVATKR